MLALRSALLLVAAAALASGCSRASRAEEGATSGPPSGRIVVFAAASLTDAFEEAADDFAARNPAVEVKLNFAGSQSLRAQIEQGAQPQVFASADREHLDALRDKGLVAEPVVFAENEMVIAVPANNPAGITSLADLPNAERLVVAGPNVPAGAYAELILERANASLGADFAERVTRRVVSREMHVRQTLQKVVLGEADAALVYATDAAAAGDKVRAIAIAPELNVKAAYPIATVKGSSNQHAANAFVDYLGSEAGRAVLARHGFHSPSRSQGGK